MSKREASSGATTMDSGPSTYADYAATPEDGQRRELLDGWIVASPSPTYPHQKIAVWLTAELVRAVEETGVASVVLAPMDVVLAENVVVEPDLLVLRNSRLGLITRRGIEGPPDLVVEILSPHSKLRDREEKRVLYGRFGVPEYWVIDPESRSVEQFRLDGDSLALLRTFAAHETLTSPEFTEIEIPLERIFRPELLQSLD